MRLSVILPTFNRPRRLEVCIQSLAEGFPRDAELIVVSDGGDSLLFPDLSRFKEGLNLKVIHAEHGGPASARNQGLEFARAPVAIFLDDDCLPHLGWLEEIANKVSIEPPVAVAGKTINGLPENVYSTAYQLILDMAERDQLQRSYGPVFYPSNNIAFPRDALRELGGFDPAFRAAEDRELCRRWLEAGFTLGKAPQALLAHAPQMTLTGFWRRFVSYGEGAAQFHADPDGIWPRESFAFHLRIPSLALAEFREKKMPRRAALSALLVVWELANLVGFVKGKWRNRKDVRQDRGQEKNP